MLLAGAGPVRRATRAVRAGPLQIGGGAPVSVQGMTKTDTRDVSRTLAQVRELAEAGCELVRLAVPDLEAARALAEIKRGSPVPLCADVHFDYRLALEALNSGVDKLRINPGNIGGPDRVLRVAAAARERGVPIRVGVNSGSLEKAVLARYGGPTAEALAESALGQVRALETAGFKDIVVSVKAPEVAVTCGAYRLLAEKVDCPFHIGITAAGPPLAGAVRSAVGLALLLAEGLGDTLRVSLTGPAVDEVRVGLQVLRALGLRRGPEVVSCPTCGRCGAADLAALAAEVERKVAGLGRPMKVAVMGCVVNGPGEAREADVGLAMGGRGWALLFSRGRVVRRVRETEALDALLGEARRLAAGYGPESAPRQE
ncbi:MAG: flavodoxin-dependent (E)-4-hydroxy-3-methylbut-2-enyl-diphosphate synthase [Acetobacteraceae bacterium]|nr:flavodoxin-dependent (E)-4-hydroxy-3-methylbut-2-enyl-diphosphate synthase [Acetobacteraceae bacterium]